MKSVFFVLVDTDICGDKRVERVLEEFSDDVRVIDIREGFKEPFSFIAFSVSLIFLAKAIFYGLIVFPIIYKDLPAYKYGFFSGFIACFFWLYSIEKLFINIKKTVDFRSAKIIHANDLYCGVLARKISFISSAEVIYDAHELEIHRNRRVGVARLVAESGLEQLVINNSSEVRVVNAVIGRVMSKWYKISCSLNIVNNDLYDHKIIRCSVVLFRPTILYVGKGVSGRMLEYLDTDECYNRFDIKCFLLGSTLPSNIGANDWFVSKETEYEKSLIISANKARNVMWCCLENKSLSYRLATPNKFFQGISICSPIIAYKGTYLAEIVSYYHIGAVFDGGNFDLIYNSVMSDEFEQWVDNIIVFRKRLREGVISI